jgi:hypothetical protein
MAADYRIGHIKSVHLQGYRPFSDLVADFDPLQVIVVGAVEEEACAGYLPHPLTKVRLETRSESGESE